MPKRPDTALYFTTVVALEKSFSVIGGHLYLEEAYPSITRFMICKGSSWNHLYDLKDIVYAATQKPKDPSKPRGTLCLMGRKGLYREARSGEAPQDTRLEHVDSLYLMGLRYIQGNLYACGVQNQVYKQVGNHWNRIDNGIFSPFAGEVDRMLMSIDGFSVDDIYAVGQGGAIWHWDGRNWRRLDSPTNINLKVVRCASDGNVYIGGGKGLILRGRRDVGWRFVESPNTNIGTVEDIEECHGRIYGAATSNLVSIESDEIVVLDVPVSGEKCFYALDSKDGVLWCVGNEAVLQYDGSQWQQFVCPDNVVRE